jgi:molybdopterin synthase catalytic subunit
VYLSFDPIDAAALRRAVDDPAAGAALVFEGVVRNHSEGLEGVVALEYEAHPTMTEKIIHAIVEETKREIPLRAVALRHRLGRVELGEPAVVIAVSADHRDEAYRASRRLIDRIKHEAPIWKREILADGSTQWSKGCTAAPHGVGAHGVGTHGAAEGSAK